MNLTKLINKIVKYRKNQKKKKEKKEKNTNKILGRAKRHSIDE
jgi:hypothetical protein